MKKNKEALKFNTCFLTTKHVFLAFIGYIALKLILTALNWNFDFYLLFELASCAVLGFAFHKGNERSVISSIGLVIFAVSQVPLFSVGSISEAFVFILTKSVPFLILLAIAITRLLTNKKFYEYLFLFPPLFYFALNLVYSLFNGLDVFSLITGTLLYLILAYWYNCNAREDDRQYKQVFKDMLEKTKAFLKTPLFAAIVILAGIIVIALISYFVIT